MGWFKKKSDPISERAKALNEQIAQLEAQIKELAEKETRSDAEQRPPEPSARPERTARAERKRGEPPERFDPPLAEPVPKLRSTALPHGHVKTKTGKAGESGLEDLSRNPFKSGSSRAGGPERDLGVNEREFSNIWKRFKRQFRGPATSNPKLVSYLAAGSIQGLRPLRYEKRVARNRTILLLLCLILILWGILAIVIR